MSNFNDTIAAISTAPGSSGIGIIRISGDDAFEISNKLFCRNKEAYFHNNGENPCIKDVSHMCSNEIRHGYIFESSPEKSEIIDECLLSKMCEPHTYTGENIVEINCHGSFAVLNRILEIVIKCGARPAEPGEFTKRAFLNGKIDLTRAEAVMDIINSKTEQSRKAAAMQLSGRLSEQINNIRERLIGCLSEVDVSIDYPEYEMDGITGDNTVKVIDEVCDELKNLSATYHRGRLIKEGIKLVIAGCPNAGKSSLMNTLAGYNRAIVTNIPGTTRDVIEEFIQIDGIPITVKDTAGLRETEDVVEKIGVDRAFDSISDAELVIYVADSADIAEESILCEHKSILNPEKTIVIVNKTDISKDKNIEYFKKFFAEFEIIYMSVNTGEGTEELYKKIKDKFFIGEIYSGSENIITNMRHKNLIDTALSHLKAAKDSHERGMPLDCISYDVWLCAEKLGEIIGKSVSDDVIDDIFRRFCVGK